MTEICHAIINVSFVVLAAIAIIQILKTVRRAIMVTSIKEIINRIMGGQNV